MEIPDLEGSAAADTPLGQLQRGRGAGWLYAAESSSGRELLLTCLSREPRWDRQVESRYEYYATLALRLQVPPAELAGAALYDADAENNWILCGVIEEMARRGSVAAAEIAATLEQDDEPADEAAWANARALLADRDAQLLGAPVEELLSEFASTGLRSALIERLTATTDPREVEVLRRTAAQIENPGWSLAMRVLGLRGDLGPLELAEQALIDNVSGATYRSARRYISGLPPRLSLPLARSWMSADEGRRDMAISVFGSHSEPSDVPVIREALAKASDYYSATDLVEALGRLQEAGPFEELDAIYAESSYSYLRARAVEAMAATDREFGSKWASECLWDAEERVRIQGATFVPVDASTVSKLQQLAADLFEEPEVREAATARLR